MSATAELSVILLTSAVIYFASKHFATSSSRLGDYLNLPRSVKGATFDAISSSLPELMVALFSVLAFKKFEVGIGTIAGSALFNLLVIPGICVLLAPVAFKVNKEIISRDGMFYNMSVFALLAALLYSKQWGLLIPIVFLLIYIWYVYDIFRDTKIHKSIAIQKADTKNISLQKEIITALINIIVIGIATYFMTESAISFAESIGIAPIIIGFTIVAAATSVPDTIISVLNAKKGDVDDAAANVFGSNIFDILIGLSIPLFIAIFYSGPVSIVFDQLEILLGLLGATILVLYFLARDHTLHKHEAYIMLSMYAVFIVYIIGLA